MLGMHGMFNEMLAWAQSEGLLLVNQLSIMHEWVSVMHETHAVLILCSMKHQFHSCSIGGLFLLRVG